MQPGDGYNLTSGQNGATLTIQEDAGNIRTGQPDQFRVTVIPNSADTSAVYIRKGFVQWCSYFASSPAVHSTLQGEVQQVWCYPSDSKVVGPYAEYADSPLTDKGGYIQLDNDDGTWGVYLIACADTEAINIPYLAVIKDGSDADTKSATFMGGNQMQIICWSLSTTQHIDVFTPSGTENISLQNVGSTIVPYNYNSQKWRIATITWDSGMYTVEQQHLGPFCIPNPVTYEGVYNYDPASAPPWIATPYYDAERAAWVGSWTGYEKTPYTATVIL